MMDARGPGYRATTPGLYQLVKHQPVLVQFFSASAEFSHCERARARLDEEIERREARVAAAAREETAFVGDAVTVVLESGALPASFAQSVKALDRRPEAAEIRILTTMRDAVMRRLEQIVQSDLDQAFVQLHKLVVQVVDEARELRGATEPAGDHRFDELAARYSELRATQRALLRQVGFGSGDWRSAAIVRNVALFWPLWHRFRRAGSSHQISVNADAVQSLPPWPVDDLRQQFAWVVAHPDAAVWVPTPTDLDDLIEAAVTGQ
jgi:hypothetical protein